MSDTTSIMFTTAVSAVLMGIILVLLAKHRLLGAGANEFFSEIVSNGTRKNNPTY